MIRALMGAVVGVTGALMIFFPALGFEAIPNQLGKDAVSRFGDLDTVWCFEPRKGSCSFITLSTGTVKGNLRYDIIELWDEDTVLTVHSGAVLRGDGLLCERGTDFIDTLDVTDRDGNRSSPALHEEVKSTLRANWAGAEAVEYCFAYVQNDTGTGELFEQYMYADGDLSENPLPFVISTDPNAMDRYTLRLNE